MNERFLKACCAAAIVVYIPTLLNKDYLIEKHADLPSEIKPIIMSVSNFLASSISGIATMATIS